VFVIRDFHFKGDNVQKTKDDITKDITSIWESIYKPEEYKSKNYDDFFIVEFQFMPHKVYFEEDFNTKCAELKQRFLPDSDNPIYPPSTEKNVPLDGMSFFID